MDPFNNRDKIAKVAKGAKEIYIFEVINEQMMYVGSSINLYNRVFSTSSNLIHRLIPIQPDSTPMLNPWFVTGFCDGEASFYVVISKTKNVKTG